MKPLFSGLAYRLMQLNLLSGEQITPLQQQAENHKISFIGYLLRQGLVAAYPLAQAVAQEFSLPLLDLTAFNPKQIPLNLLAPGIVLQYQLLPLLQRGKQLFLAVVDPTNQEALEVVKFQTGLLPYGIVVEADKLAHLLNQLQRQNFIFATQESENTELMNFKECNTSELSSSAEEAPIVQYVHNLLQHALEKRASDIHCEPYEHSYRIRFRIDSILYEVANPPLSWCNSLTTRLKIMANLDIAERRIPQDGRFKVTFSKEKLVDFRISTCPTLFGEKIVIRMVTANHHVLAVNKLGLLPEQKNLFINALEQPQGMILVTGPTGSGKTFTLYTALSLLNNEQVNIASVEDPIEIYLPGVNQVPSNPKAGLTFASILRAFLRQDPDIIMVGEIRDKETAEIAVNAAHTGHLVLSTLHTNTAIEALTRFINMGIAPYNIASSTQLIIAQRLIRKLCIHCKTPVTLASTALLHAGFLASEIDNIKLFAAVGCKYCTQGYRGREGIFELLLISPTLRQLIIRYAGELNTVALAQQAQTEGMQTLRAVGLEKVKSGITSLTELNRVVGV